MRELAHWRSILFAPGNDERKLRRTLGTEAHLAVADLEDAVPAREKARARDVVADVFGGSEGTGVARAVRLNAAGTEALGDDLALLSGFGLDAVLLPKATPDAIASLPDDIPPVIAMIETAAGLRDVHRIAESGRVVALALGAADLALELGLEPRPDGQEVLFARAQLVLASACAGLRAPFDQVAFALDDVDALRHEVQLARSLGFQGKLCIHPSQLGLVNDGFGPSSAEIAWAEQVVAEFERAVLEGRGAIRVAGQLVDAPVVDRARRVLAESGRGC